MELIVKKPIHNLREGDVFEWDENLDAWVCNIDDADASDEMYVNARISIVNEELMKSWEVQGIVIAKGTDYPEKTDTTLGEILAFVNEQIEHQEANLDEVMTGYFNGTVQPCVKVETETVAYNVCKVLHKIKEIINE